MYYIYINFTISKYQLKRNSNSKKTNKYKHTFIISKHTNTISNSNITISWFLQKEKLLFIIIFNISQFQNTILAKCQHFKNHNFKISKTTQITTTQTKRNICLFCFLFYQLSKYKIVNTSMFMFSTK